MSDYIPPDLISHILARLPIKAVLRFRHVSKSWYELISSSSFINLHLNSSIANTESRVILRLTIENDEKQHYYLHRDNQAFEQIQELQPPGNPNVDIGIYGSSNGVFCCSSGDGRIKTIYGERLILWNPSLGKSLILPKSRDGKLSKHRQQRNIGFGFLPSSTNFKIVRLIYTQNSDRKFCVPPEVEIYEFYTGSWRDVNAAEISYVLEGDNVCSQALLNGIVHWTAQNLHSNGGKFEGLIVSFDLESEKFGTLMLPKCVKNYKEPHHFSVFTSKEYLCLTYCYGEGHSIFIMKEYGVIDSWEKLFAIESSDFMTLYLRQKAEILIAKFIDFDFDRQKYSLVSCDPKTNEMMDLGVHEDGLYFDRAYPYVDSLFLIEDSNESNEDFKKSKKVH